MKNIIYLIVIIYIIKNHKNINIYLHVGLSMLSFIFIYFASKFLPGHLILQFFCIYYFDKLTSFRLKQIFILFYYN